MSGLVLQQMAIGLGGGADIAGREGFAGNGKHFFGMTWSALLKSLGATSIAVGWTSSDIIGNLIQGFWILASHPFAIGDQIEVGAVSGTVADMNLSYVVLEHADKSHTLVPYAVLKASPFTVLSKAPLAGAAQ